jgi:UDP-N-acetylglucosamine 4-epimerase
MNTDVRDYIKKNSRNWLVTGGAGFIGSHLLETLLKLGQKVTVLDNFSTGYMENIKDVLNRASAFRDNFTLLKGDIREMDSCREACDGADIVLHEAALGSVPRSIADPETSNAVNVGGFLNMLVAAKEAKISRFVFASSSSVYGDISESPKREDSLGKPLSPYAITKRVNELYAANFADIFDLHTVGLRYFNVFGPRQDPNGAYAAVMPRWIYNLMNNIECEIYGDGENSRDFCYIDNVVQANLLAAVMPVEKGDVFNIACNDSITLNKLYQEIESLLTDYTDRLDYMPVRYRPARAGDIKHSLADITKASTYLNYMPKFNTIEGLKQYIAWAVQTYLPFEYSEVSDFRVAANS